MNEDFKLKILETIATRRSNGVEGFSPAAYSGNLGSVILTIVKKGAASKIVSASKKAGATGGTIMLGKGTAGKSIYTDLLGMDFDPEKEIILTFVKKDIADTVMESILKEGKLNKPGNGICFVVNMKGPSSVWSMEVDNMSDNQQIKYDLIVTIVNKGFGEEVVEATKKAGAQGGTIMYGRGTGIHENATIFGIPIEPEKEIVLTLIYRTKTDQVLSAINHAVDINKPGKGISFVMQVEKTAGICHQY